MSQFCCSQLQDRHTSGRLGQPASGHPPQVRAASNSASEYGFWRSIERGTRPLSREWLTGRQLGALVWVKDLHLNDQTGILVSAEFPHRPLDQLIPKRRQLILGDTHLTKSPVAVEEHIG